jgi:hypothetical protein
MELRGRILTHQINFRTLELWSWVYSGYATGWTIGVRFPALANISLVATASGSGSYPASYPEGLKALSAKAERQGREPKHSCLKLHLPALICFHVAVLN